MTEVSDVLRDRMHESDGLQRMLAVSLAAHVVAFAFLVVAPGAWFSRQDEEPRTVMTITLGGGGEGPRTGATAMGGRPVQVQTPPQEVKRPEPVRPPAAKTPEMTLPTKAAAKPTRPTPPVTPIKQAPDEARGRTPTRGAETSAGSAIAATGARGQGFGLSGGGGPGMGSTLDVADFCCPDYLVTMTERIRSNWTQQPAVSRQPVVHFTIQRDGTLTNVVIEQSSGSPIVDLAAQRAIIVTKQIPALPAQYPNSTLGVHLTFLNQQ